MFTSIFGIVVVLKQMSLTDRLERKKYMGVWRWESELTARMMSRFPRTVTKYMDRKRLKRKDHSSGPSVTSMRRNSEARVLFICSILLINLMGKVE